MLVGQVFCFSIWSCTAYIEICEHSTPTEAVHSIYLLCYAFAFRGCFEGGNEFLAFWYNRTHSGGEV